MEYPEEFAKKMELVQQMVKLARVHRVQERVGYEVMLTIKNPRFLSFLYYTGFKGSIN